MTIHQLPDVDVRLTDEQLLLQQSARDFLAAECPIEVVRRVMEAPAELPEALWREMAELGWMGLIVPEAWGGAGLDVVDLAVLFEEAGRVLLPAPLFSTVVLGGSAVALAGNEEQKQGILPALARGELRLTLALGEGGGRFEQDAVRLSAKRRANGFVLEGRKLFVPDAHWAHRAVVVARLPEGVSLFLVDRDAPGVSVRPIETIDGSRPLCELELSAVEVPEDALLGEAGAGWATIEHVLDRARAALCAEMCGGAQAVLDLSVAYAKTREQFDRPIGSFQAISHTCADMFVRVESMRSAAYYAAWSLAAGEPDAHASSCMALGFCADAYAWVAGRGIQIHGGLGFTWEQDLHLYYKRAKACEVALGDPAWSRELAAREIIDRPALPG